MAYITKPRLKELEHFEKNTFCCFCKQNHEDQLNYGKIYQYGHIVTHYFCILFSSGLDQKGGDEEGILGFLPVDIQKELDRSLMKLCSYCNHEGASIYCSFGYCKKRFHYPCAFNNGSLHQFFDPFRSYCHNHRHIQKVPASACKRNEKTTCPICLDEVMPLVTQETIWPPCCKTAWFHKICIRKMAVEHGAHFFKCPNCRNGDIFVKEMKECGIYIPDQDASWELEPNAYQELNERHSHCDAEMCYAPPNVTWEVILCSQCGSHGTHVQCEKKEILHKRQWVCALCSTVTSGTIRPRPSDTGRSERKRSTTGRRGRKRKNFTLPSDNSGPAEKVVCPQETSSEIEHGTEGTAPCLLSNAGQPIQVVRVDSTQTTDERVVEIGGVVEPEIVELNSDDDCESSGVKIGGTVEPEIIELSSDDDCESNGVDIRNPSHNRVSSTTKDSICKDADIIIIEDSDEDDESIGAIMNFLNSWKPDDEVIN